MTRTVHLTTIDQAAKNHEFLYPLPGLETTLMRFLSIAYWPLVFIGTIGGSVLVVMGLGALAHTIWSLLAIGCPG